MEQIHQTHLSNVLSFLHRKTNVTGFKPLRNAIQIQLRRSKPPNQADEAKKLTSMCTRCFTYWKEGNFSVKFKPKYKHGKNISKRMVLKCLVCNHKEYQSYNQSELNFSIDQKKIKPITKKKNTPFKSKPDKKTTKVVTSKAKTKTKNNSKKHPGKNKSKRKEKKK